MSWSLVLHRACSSQSPSSPPNLFLIDTWDTIYHLWDFFNACWRSINVFHRGHQVTATSASFGHSQTSRQNRFAMNRTLHPLWSCRGARREDLASHTGSLCRISQLRASVQFQVRQRDYSLAKEACSVPRFAIIELDQLQESSTSCSIGRWFRCCAPGSNWSDYLSCLHCFALTVLALVSPVAPSLLLLCHVEAFQSLRVSRPL